jgi:hypothetical protein
VKLVRAELLVDARPLSKVSGQPFRAGEIESAILDHLAGPTRPAVSAGPVSGGIA